MNGQQKSDYQLNRKPRSEFATRTEYLDHELQSMSPRRWKPNLPVRDYRFEFEDFVPAMAATIVKIVMVAAIVGAFAGGGHADSLDSPGHNADDFVRHNGGHRHVPWSGTPLVRAPSKAV